MPTPSKTRGRCMTGWTHDSRCLCLPRVIPCSHARGRATRTDLSSRDFLSGLQAPALLQQHLRDLGSGSARKPSSLTRRSSCRCSVCQPAHTCVFDSTSTSVGGGQISLSSGVIAAADGRYGHHPRPTATLAGGHRAVRYHCDRDMGSGVVEPMDPPT